MDLEDKNRCQGVLHPMAIKGMELFNEGRYWHAHEALEEAWLAEAGEVRNLYRGILQAGVVYLHVTRANYRGAYKVYYRCRRWLDPFPSSCRGINVGRLKQDLDIVFSETLRLGPADLKQFDLSLLKPIIYQDS
jgi:predicted metal-dependent hydrolase